jgi:uncharacterized protein (UPF0332 family)
MTSTPQGLLGAAEFILTTAKDEGMFRSAVSRAYYASYHCCREYHAGLQGIGQIGAAKGRHEQLISQLLAPSQKLTANGKARSMAIGKYLRAICDSRVRADYDLTSNVDQSIANEALAVANAIFKGTAIKSGPLADN